MKHVRLVSQKPAVATSAAVAKIDFKVGVSGIIAGAAPIVTDNIGSYLAALIQNSLALGSFIEIIFGDNSTDPGA